MRTDDTTPKSAAGMLTLQQAREIMESSISALSGYQQIILKDCLGRVLFEDICSPINIPREAQSSMDGYALNSQELDPNGISRFNVAGTSWAGRPYPNPLKNGECVRIFTGAAIPSGADSVVIQENVIRNGDIIEIPSATRTQENIRMPGDEIVQGQRVLNQGKRLSPADMGILASLGINEIRARRMPRVVFFSTGDELVSLDKPIEAAQIYDSNRYTLYGMLTALGIDPVDFGVVRDNYNAIFEALMEAAAISDAIITSGGVSVGEADLVNKALASAGRIEFWKIAIKPGKPLAFGQIGKAYFFGLPGNPVSVYVTFYQIVRPALLRMMGADATKTHRLRACCRSEIIRTPGRQEFQRAKLMIDESGKAHVVPAEKQQSHNLSAMAQSNCFIVLPAECEVVRAGEQVEVEWIDSAFHFI